MTVLFLPQKKFQIYTIDSNYPVIILDNRKLAKLVFYYIQEVRYE